MSARREPTGPWLVVGRLHANDGAGNPMSWIAPASWGTRRRYPTRWRARLEAWRLNRAERAYVRAARRAHHGTFGPGTSWEVAHQCERPAGTPERYVYDPLAALAARNAP